MLDCDCIQMTLSVSVQFVFVHQPLSSIKPQDWSHKIPPNTYINTFCTYVHMKIESHPPCKHNHSYLYTSSHGELNSTPYHYIHNVNAAKYKSLYFLFDFERASSAPSRIIVMKISKSETAYKICPKIALFEFGSSSVASFNA